MWIYASAASKTTLRGSHEIESSAIEAWRVTATADRVTVRFSTSYLSMSGNYSASLTLTADEVAMLAAKLNEAQRERIAALEAEISTLRGAGEN